jgi:hypothetical protein
MDITSLFLILPKSENVLSGSITRNYIKCPNHKGTCKPLLSRPNDFTSVYKATCVAAMTLVVVSFFALHIFVGASLFLDVLH